MKKNLFYLILLFAVFTLFASCSNSAETEAIKLRMVSYASEGKDSKKRFEFYSPAYYEEAKAKGSGWDMALWSQPQWDSMYAQLTKVHQKLMETGIAIAPADVSVKTYGKFAEAEVGVKFPELKEIPVYWVKDGEQWFLYFKSPKEIEKYGTP